MNPLAQQDFYLNFNQFTDLKREARANSEQAAGAASQQFESLFIQQMLKEMRSAAVVDPDQHSSYMDFYTDMYDKQLSLMMAKSGGIGLAETLKSQLIEQQPHPIKEPESVGNIFPLNQNIAANLPLKTDIEGMPVPARDVHLNATSVNTQSFSFTKNELNTALVLDSKVTLHALISEPSVSNDAISNLDALVEFHQIQDQVDNSAVKLNQYVEISSSKTLSDEPIQSHYGWENSTQFVAELMPMAQQVSGQLGIPAEVLVAQSALETGWGQHTMRNQDGSISFSLFGIKADHRWSGETVSIDTLEYRNGQVNKEHAQFRAYESVSESLQDYVAFIQNSPRYQSALEHNGDAEHYVKGLQQAGYATDPNYANKILKILNSETIQKAAVQSTHYSEVA